MNNRKCILLVFVLAFVIAHAITDKGLLISRLQMSPRDIDSIDIMLLPRHLFTVVNINRETFDEN